MKPSSQYGADGARRGGDAGKLEAGAPARPSIDFSNRRLQHQAPAQQTLQTQQTQQVLQAKMPSNANKLNVQAQGPLIISRRRNSDSVADGKGDDAAHRMLPSPRSMAPSMTASKMVLGMGASAAAAGNQGDGTYIQNHRNLRFMRVNANEMSVAAAAASRPVWTTAMAMEPMSRKDVKSDIGLSLFDFAGIDFDWLEFLKGILRSKNVPHGGGGHGAGGQNASAFPPASQNFREGFHDVDIDLDEPVSQIRARKGAAAFGGSIDRDFGNSGGSVDPGLSVSPGASMQPLSISVTKLKGLTRARDEDFDDERMFRQLEELETALLELFDEAKRQEEASKDNLVKAHVAAAKSKSSLVVHTGGIQSSLSKAEIRVSEAVGFLSKLIQPIQKASQEKEALELALDAVSILVEMPHDLDLRRAARLLAKLKVVIDNALTKQSMNANLVEVRKKIEQWSTELDDVLPEWFLQFLNDTSLDEDTKIAWMRDIAEAAMMLNGGNRLKDSYIANIPLLNEPNPPFLAILKNSQAGSRGSSFDAPKVISSTGFRGSDAGPASFRSKQTPLSARLTKGLNIPSSSNAFLAPGGVPFPASGMGTTPRPIQAAGIGTANSSLESAIVDSLTELRVDIFRTMKKEAPLIRELFSDSSYMYEKLARELITQKLVRFSELVLGYLKAEVEKKSSSGSIAQQEKHAEQKALDVLIKPVKRHSYNTAPTPSPLSKMAAVTLNLGSNTASEVSSIVTLSALSSPDKNAALRTYLFAIADSRNALLSTITELEELAKENGISISLIPSHFAYGKSPSHFDTYLELEMVWFKSVAEETFRPVLDPSTLAGSSDIASVTTKSSLRSRTLNQIMSIHDGMLDATKVVLGYFKESLRRVIDILPEGEREGGSALLSECFVVLFLDVLYERCTRAVNAISSLSSSGSEKANMSPGGSAASHTSHGALANAAAGHTPIPTSMAAAVGPTGPFVRQLADLENAASCVSGYFEYQLYLNYPEEFKHHMILQDLDGNGAMGRFMEHAAAQEGHGTKHAHTRQHPHSGWKLHDEARAVTLSGQVSMVALAFLQKGLRSLSENVEQGFQVCADFIGTQIFSTLVREFAMTNPYHLEIANQAVFISNANPPDRSQDRSPDDSLVLGTPPPLQAMSSAAAALATRFLGTAQIQLLNRYKLWVLESRMEGSSFQELGMDPGLVEVFETAQCSQAFEKATMFLREQLVYFYDHLEGNNLQHGLKIICSTVRDAVFDFWTELQRCQIGIAGGYRILIDAASIISAFREPEVRSDLYILFEIGYVFLCQSNELWNLIEQDQFPQVDGRVLVALIRLREDYVQNELERICEVIMPSKAMENQAEVLRRIYDTQDRLNLSSNSNALGIGVSSNSLTSHMSGISSPLPSSKAPRKMSFPKIVSESTGMTSEVVADESGLAKAPSKQGSGSRAVSRHASGSIGLAGAGSGPGLLAGLPRQQPTASANISMNLPPTAR